MAAQDPFVTVRKETQALCRQIESQFEQLKSQDATLNGETRAGQIALDLQSLLKQVSDKLEDLSKTLVIVEQQRERFRQLGITDEEFSQRQQFVSEKKTFVTRMTEGVAIQLNSRRRQAAQSARAALMSEAKSRPVNSSNGAAFIKEREAQQQLVEAKQEEVLMDMSHALDRLKGVSVDIGKSLTEHKELIQNMDENMDEAKGRFEVTVRKLDTLLGKKDTGRWCLIIGLALAAVILLCLIFWL